MTAQPVLTTCSDEELDRLRQQRTIDLRTAGRLWGIGRDQAYTLAAAGQLPFPALRIGTRWRVPVQPLLASLGLADTPAAVSPDR